MRVLPLWNLDYSQWNLDTANEMRVCYIYSFFITSNITVSSLLTFQEHTEVLQESPDLLSLFPLPPLRKRSGPQTIVALWVELN